MEPADLWILSKLQKLVRDATILADRCKLHEYAKAIENFIINQLSQVYIPITRTEIWDEDESRQDRHYTIYAVLLQVLRTLDILIHPISPDISEYLYLNGLHTKNILDDAMTTRTISAADTIQKSILLDDWPTPQDSLINDKVESAFDLLQDCVSIAASARMKAKLKRRWPLNEAIICIKTQDNSTNQTSSHASLYHSNKQNQKEMLLSLSSLLQAQLNVEKCVIYEISSGIDATTTNTITDSPSTTLDDLAYLLEMQKRSLPIKPKVDLDRKKIGPKAKHLVSSVLQKYQETDPAIFIESLQKNSRYVFELKGEQEKVVAVPDDFIICIDAADGYAIAQRNNITVILSTVRNKEMMARGLVKDTARRIQTMRKEKGYNPTDILQKALILDLDESSKQMLEEKSKELAFLIRVNSIQFTQGNSNNADTSNNIEYKNDDIDGKKIRIGLVK